MADINSSLPVNITDIVPGTGATNLGKAEDAAHSSGDTGVMILAVRTAADGPRSSTDGDYEVLQTDANGYLKVTVKAGVTDATATDDAAFTPGSGKGIPSFAMFDDVAPDSVDEGDAGILRMSANRNLYIQIRDGAGNERGLNIDTSGNIGIGSIIPGTGATNLGKAEDAIHSSGDVGIMSLAVRKDTAAALAGADGDYAPFEVDALGQLWTRIGNTEAQAIPVYVTGARSGGEINNYDTTVALAASGTDNHDYTVTTSKTLMLKGVTFAASGKMKVEIKTGPLASLVTQGVYFTTSAMPSFSIVFPQPIEVPDTSTGTVRIARTNLESSSMDVYSTINGVEV